MLVVVLVVVLHGGGGCVVLFLVVLVCDVACWVLFWLPLPTACSFHLRIAVSSPLLTIIADWFYGRDPHCPVKATGSYDQRSLDPYFTVAMVELLSFTADNC
jgi:hypothetical protein